MKILVSGDNIRMDEFKTKLAKQPEGLVYCHTDEMQDMEGLEEYDAIIDLNLDEYDGKLELYAELEDTTVLVCAVKQSLAEMAAMLDDDPACKLMGFNALPGFINRPLAEISLYKESSASAAKALFDTLGWGYRTVVDRVGMVSPRIIFMIINEAFYTLQEGTASEEDIDLSMKLGTNYPNGPFQWCDDFGIMHVYEVLDALYNDTKEERYKICPLLKKRYLAALQDARI